MLLPSHTTTRDIETICAYLADRPSGAGIQEATDAFGKTARNVQRRIACRQLGFIRFDENGRVQVTEIGSGAVWRDGRRRARSYLDAVSKLPAYKAIIEKAASKDGMTFTTAEVASFWHRNFPDVVASTDKDKHEQAVCLFGLLEGAALGQTTVGRRGQPTRFKFHENSLLGFLHGREPDLAEPPGAFAGKPGTDGAAAKIGFRGPDAGALGRAGPREENYRGEPAYAATQDEPVPQSVSTRKENPVLLPNHTTRKDLEAICGHLLDKPAGAARAEVAAVFGNESRGGRKRNVCELLGFVAPAGDGRLAVTERGRRAIGADAGRKVQSYLEAISGIGAYRAFLGDAARAGRLSVTASEVVSFWQGRFPAGLSSANTERINQATCFFRLLEGAAMGGLTLGNRVQVTQFDFEAGKLRMFAEAREEDPAEAPGGGTEQREAQAPPGEAGLPQPETGEGRPADAHAEPSGEPEAAAATRETGLQSSQSRKERQMQLPANATEEDMAAFCTFLMDRPAGASLAEVRDLFGARDANGQKRSACLRLGFMEKTPQQKIRLTERGRAAVSDRGRRKSRSYLEAILSFPAYTAFLQRAVNQDRLTFTTADVSDFWHGHFRSVVSIREQFRSNQAVCYFRWLEAAELGELTVRRGERASRFVFDAGRLRKIATENRDVFARVHDELAGEPDDAATSGKGVPPGAEEGEMDDAAARRGRRPLLPGYVTPRDIEAVCGYLADRPAGATGAEVSALLGENPHAGKKRRACRRLGFIVEDAGGMMKVTERGRRAVADGGMHKAQSYLEAISEFGAYREVLAEMVTDRDRTLLAPEVVSLWLERFPSQLSGAETGRMIQAMCFFRLLAGAGKGKISFGRHGEMTRFVFKPGEPREFLKKGDRDLAEEHGDATGEPKDDTVPEDAVSADAGNAGREPSEIREPSPQFGSIGPGPEDRPGQSDTAGAGGLEGADGSGDPLQPLSARFDAFWEDFDKMRVDNANARTDNAETIGMMSREIADIRGELADLRVQGSRRHRRLLYVAAAVVAFLGGLNLLLGL